MAWKVTIDAGAGEVDKTTYVEQNGVAVDEVGNGRWTATVRWRKGYFPVRGNKIIVYQSDGTTPYFAGIVWTVNLIPLGPTTYKFSTDCVDLNVYADQRVVFASYTSTVSEYTILSDLVTNYLSPMGVAVSSGQANPGTSFAPFTWAGRRLSECLNDLGVQDKKLWRIAPEYVGGVWVPRIKRSVPAASSAPFGLAEGGLNWTWLKWLQTYGTQTQGQYANRVILRFMGTGSSATAYLHSTANFANGETVTVGSKTYTFRSSYTNTDGSVTIGVDLGASLDRLCWAINLQGTPGVDYAAVMTANGQVEGLRNIIGNPTYGGVLAVALVVGASGNSIGCTTTAANAHWGDAWGTATSTLQGGGDATLSNMSVKQDAGEQATYGIWDFLVDAANIFDQTTADNTATGVLAQMMRNPKVVSFGTRTAGLTVGQKININLPTSRNITNTDFLISQVRTIPHANRPWEYEVTANEGTVYLPSALQAMASGGVGGGTTVNLSGSSGNSQTSIAASPFSLGGSREDAIVADTYQFVPSFMPYTAPANGTYHVRAYLFARDAGVGVTSRLYNMDGNLAMSPTSSKKTSQKTSDLTTLVTFDVVLAEGITYGLQILSDTAGAWVYGQGNIIQTA